MATTNFAFDQRTEDELVANIGKNGFVCLESVIDSSFLSNCRSSIDSLLETKGERFFSIIQPNQTVGGVFSEMADTPGFVPLLRNIARRLHSDAAVRDFELYSVLRVIGGAEAEKGAFEFHYDATVLTVLMPLYIPTGAPGTTGELFTMPNRRNYRSSPVTNVVEKTITQNPLAFRYYAHKYGKPGKHIVNLIPGNLYFFAGYRTFHGNLPCTSGEKRATLIFHFGNPHAGSSLTKMILRLRKLREERRLNAT